MLRNNSTAATNILNSTIPNSSELTLILAIVTNLVKKVFLLMKLIKTNLENRMRDYWMNDILIVYIERKIFEREK